MGAAGRPQPGPETPTYPKPQSPTPFCRVHFPLIEQVHVAVRGHGDAELGRNARRACNLALLRSALLGALLRDGPINLSALTQHYAFHPSAALRFLRSPRAQS